MKQHVVALDVCIAVIEVVYRQELPYGVLCKMNELVVTVLSLMTAVSGTPAKVS